MGSNEAWSRDLPCWLFKEPSPSVISVLAQSFTTHLQPTVNHDLCNIEVAIIVLCLSNYLMRQLLSTELGSAAVSQMRTQPSHYTKLFNAHFQKTLHHIESSQYDFLLFLLFFLFTTVSPSPCVRYSGCPHPPPLPHSPSAARCTAPPSPVRWKR